MARCKRVGLKKRVCSECGDEYLVTYGPVHKYEWESVTEATCENQGKDSGVTGYQVMYSTKSDLSDGKSVYVTKNTSVKKTIKGLKAKKKYYVKVRSYKKVGNSKYYGAWSDTQKVKTK